MAARVLDRPFSLPQPSNITSLRFGLVRFYPQPRQTERHRTYTLCIRRYLEVIPGLLSPGRLTAGVIGPRRLRLVITQRARGFLIQRSMFRPMAGPLRASFMTIGIIPALMCWLIFTSHNPLISVIPGSPTSGLLRSQPMPPSLRSPPMVTCLVIILALPKLLDQRCRYTKREPRSVHYARRDCAVFRPGYSLGSRARITRASTYYLSTCPESRC